MSGRQISREHYLMMKNRMEFVLTHVIGGTIPDFVPSSLGTDEYMMFLEMLKELFQVETDYSQYLEVISQREKAVEDYKKKTTQIIQEEVAYKNAALSFFNCSSQIKDLQIDLTRICNIYKVDSENCRLVSLHIMKMNQSTHDLRKRLFLKIGKEMTTIPGLFDTLAKLHSFNLDLNNIRKKITDSVKNHFDMKIEIGEIYQTIIDCDQQLLEFRSFAN